AAGGAPPTTAGLPMGWLANVPPPGGPVAGQAGGDGVPGVAGQLVSVLSAPRPTANGTYSVSVALHPESLGTVQATVTAGQDQVTVRLVAATNAGSDAIRSALPQLHEALAASGQRASVSLAGGGAGGGHSIGQQGAGQQSAGNGGSPGSGAGAPRTPSGSAGAISVTARGAAAAGRDAVPGPSAGRSGTGGGRGSAGTRLVDVRV
ncbi:MAG: flagellar hook-length control protein FliK, partial [Acidimicrobiales bacterium]